jgi:Ser/Thr protein kinase RdoA (MazF antagonist)
MTPMQSGVHPRLSRLNPHRPLRSQASGYLATSDTAVRRICRYRIPPGAGVACLVATDELIRTVLRTRWQCTPQHIAALADGSWRVCVDGRHLLVTLTPAAQHTRLLAGLAVAEHLSQSGFPAGRPVRAVDGAPTVPVEEGLLAVVHDVPGRPLDPADPLDQQWWGDRLGAAHRALTGFGHPRLTRLAWLTVDGPHLGLVPWLRPAIVAALGALTRLTVTDQLTYGVLHGDPAAEAFRIDPDTGSTGIVDWRAAATGPLVYDLAAAVGYAGGIGAAGELIDGYLSAGPVSADEVESALPVLLRYWYAERLDALARVEPDPRALDELRAAMDEVMPF